MATKTKAKPKAKAKKKSGGLKTQVQAESDLRYGPQRQALSDTAGDLKTTRDDALRNAVSTSRGSIQAADAAKPEVAKRYVDSTATVTALQGKLAEAVKGYAGTADTLKSSIAEDSTGTLRRLAESERATQNELTSRKVDAKAGEAQAKRTAIENYGTGLSKIAGQRSGLAQQEGAFAQSRSGELKTENRKLGQTDRGLDIKEKAATSKGKKGSLPGGVKPATPAVRAHAQTQIDTATTYIKQLRAAGADDKQIRSFLLTGHKESGTPAVTTKYRDKNNIIQTKTVTPATQATTVPKVEKDYVNTAFDILDNSGASKPNRDALHRSGLTIKGLGIAKADPKKEAVNRRKRQNARGRFPASARPG